MKHPKLYPFILMHCVALIWGSSGVWSTFISLSVAQTVSGRCVIAATALGLLALVQRQVTVPSNWSCRGIAWLVASAAMLGLHWYCFFYTIKHGSIALGLVTFATAPIFVALLEPFIRHERHHILPVVCAVLSLVGIWCVHPVTFGAAAADLTVALVGILGACALALCTLVTRYRLGTMHPTFVCCGINLIIALGMFPFAPILLSELTLNDSIGLFGLGLFCSALGQTLFVIGMRHVAAGTASIIASLEAPYGVILAALFGAEPLTLRIVIGMTLVCVGVYLVTRRELGQVWE